MVFYLPLHLLSCSSLAIATQNPHLKPKRGSGDHRKRWGKGKQVGSHFTACSPVRKKGEGEVLHGGKKKNNKAVVSGSGSVHFDVHKALGKHGSRFLRTDDTQNSVWFQVKRGA